MRKIFISIILSVLSIIGFSQTRSPFIHYSFDNTLIDSTLSGNDLVANSGATFTGADKAWGTHSGVLAGSDDFFKTPVAFDLGNNFIISMWIKTASDVSTTQYIFSAADSVNPTTDNFYIRFIATNILRPYVGGSSANPAFTWTANTWHHLLFYINDNSTNAIVRTWFDGDRCPVTDSIMTAGFPKNTRWMFGADQWYNQEFIGNIDEVRIYKDIEPDQAFVDSVRLGLYKNTPSAGGYNPVPGRHMLFFADGIQLKDKGRSGNFYYWKAPFTPMASVMGINTSIRTTDYDGVCPAGSNRWLDADCACNNFEYAPLRKIADTTDYATKVYIDPNYGNGGNGTLATPYNQWSDVTQAANTAYLIKKGTILNENIDITEHRVLLGSYGISGAKPKIVNPTVSHAVDVYSDSCTIRDLEIRNKTVLTYSTTNQLRTSYANINVQVLNNNTDVFNCDLRAGGFGWGSQNGSHKVDRIINCTIDSMFTEGIYSTASDYLDVGWTTITNINLAYAINPDYNWGGTNAWCTGDGIERYVYGEGNGWKEQWVHNCTIDRRPYGNKSCIMFHNNTTQHLRDITEFNVFYAPLNNGLPGASSQIINSGGPGKSIFLNNIFYGVECDYPTTGLYETGNDTIIGNIFVGLDYAIQGGLNGIVENNTFYNNVNAIYRSSGSIARLFNNIFWMNTTNLNTITATIYGNNLYTNPSFTNANNNDFSLLSGSPAINSGYNNPKRLYDLFGTSTPQGSIMDIGAVESDFSSSPDPVEEEDIEYYLAEDFETWVEADVDSKTALSEKLPMSIQNYNGSGYHSIQDVGGSHGNVWQIMMPEDGHVAYNGYIHLGDTARELYYQYDLYVQSDFDKYSKNGIASGKLPGGFAMGSSLSALQDTINVPGLAGHTHNVWGTSADQMLYSYDHDHFGYANGAAGTWPIPRGYWQTKTIRLNVGDPGKHNGFVEMFIDGVLDAQWTGLKFRSLSQGEDFGKIEALFNSYQFGGGSEYLCPKNQYIRFDNLLVYKYNTTSEYYVSGPSTSGRTIPIIELPSRITPDFLVHDESYTNPSDTIHDTGNNTGHIYNVPNNNTAVYKTVTRPSGTISFTFLVENFGYAGGGNPYYVQVYSGSVAPGNLLYTFGRTEDGYTNPSGTYNISNSTAVFVFRVGDSNYDVRKVIIRYWQP